MNNSLQEYLDQFIQKILSQKEVKQYLLLKEEIANSEELTLLSEEIKSAKKALALSFGSSLHQQRKEEYLDLVNKYDTHPLIVNFNIVKEEVGYLLDKIEKALKD